MKIKLLLTLYLHIARYAGRAAPIQVFIEDDHEYDYGNKGVMAIGMMGSGKSALGNSILDA